MLRLLSEGSRATSRVRIMRAGPVEFVCLNPFQKRQNLAELAGFLGGFAKSGVNPGSGYQVKSMG
jgi:hypothetical protein